MIVLGMVPTLGMTARAQDAPPVPQIPPDPFTPAPPRFFGCAIQGIGEITGGLPGIIKNYGDDAIDTRIRADLNGLAGWFQVFPRFYFMEDGAQPNALWCPLLLGDPEDFPPDRGTAGTILFGKALIQAEMNSTPRGEQNYTVTAILAHELSHTLQHKKQNPLPVVHKELQADFMAGWTIKRMQRAGGADVDEAVVMSSFYKKGEFQFNNPQHHGTRKERLASFLAGYDVDADDVDVAYQKGEAYVRNTPLENGQNQAPVVQREFFAGNLGVFYEPKPRPDGTSGLRITRPPAPDSPGGKGGLEEGDVILQLDSQPFRNELDVLGHTGQTTFSVIDVKTGQTQEGTLTLP